MVREIPLTQGYVALVDDADYDFLMHFKWSLYFDSDGKPRYARHGMMIDGKYRGISMHRLLMAAPDGVQVDHKDGNGLNNQRDNLRYARHDQNAWNWRHRDGRLKGARKSGRHSWVCQIRKNDEFLYFGTYHSEEMAAKVYDAAAVRLYGEFANTNFPQIDPDADAIAAAIIAGEKPQKPARIARKLTDADAIDIRETYARGDADGTALAAKYGVCRATIYHVLRGRTFPHLPGANPTDKRVARLQEAA